MVTIEKPTNNRTNDGFLCHADGTLANGLITIAVNNREQSINNKE
jgi:hypothetical protein